MLKRVRNRQVLAADCLCILFTPAVALALRLDLQAWSEVFVAGLILYTLASVPIKVFIFTRFTLYQRYWKHASLEDAFAIAKAVAAACVLLTLLVTLIQGLDLFPTFNLPRSVPIIDGFLTLLFAGGIRFAIRHFLHERKQVTSNGKNAKRVIIVGAGQSGVAMARELLRDEFSTLVPVGFIDDDSEKLGLSVHGIPVLGDRTLLPNIVETQGVEEVIIAMPSASGQVIREVVDVCSATGVPSRTLPSIHEIASGKVALSALRSVQVEDLLRRDPIKTDLDSVEALVKGKRVLVSGGGGSIGSELCRQLLRFHPKELFVFGHGENSIFEIVSELQLRQDKKKALLPKDRENTKIVPLIGDIRSLKRLHCIMESYRPEIVFHAAAHKHVPLMEIHPSEAISNNVLGTKNLLKAASAAAVSHFVFISSDKAIQPTSVMGATKRTAEYLVHEAAKKTGRAYVTVRFGNVLGSRGSVIRTFQRQIACGGPITVTHPDIERYFMTIPEAVQLVLQASVLGSGGEIFVLDMGQPVRVIDLAKDMVRLSGLEFGHDIDIVFTGLREGEKLFEDLFDQEEVYERSRHEKVFIVKNADSLVPSHLEDLIADLCESASKNDSDQILKGLADLVPGFNPIAGKRITEEPTKRPVVRKLELESPDNDFQLKIIKEKMVTEMVESEQKKVARNRRRKARHQSAEPDLSNT